MTYPETNPERLPPELVADIAAAEAEAEAALTAHPSPPVADTPKSDPVECPSVCERCGGQLIWTGPFSTRCYNCNPSVPGVLPLADLRVRLQMCREAGVEEYHDGPLVIRFSADVLRAQRELLRPSVDPQPPVW
jgi:hypothetical protein